MRPESSALRVLAAIVAEDIQSLSRLDGALEKFSAGIETAAWDSANLWASAGVLHGIYNAIENSLLRVSNTLGDQVDRSDRWHADLLHRAFLDVPEVRPAILPAEIQPLVRELLAFRHLYRHGYDLELDGTKLSRLIEHWRKDKSVMFTALKAFHEHLLSQAEAVE